MAGTPIEGVHLPTTAPKSLWPPRAAERISPEGVCDNSRPDRARL
jgi:hypothetical protein